MENTEEKQLTDLRQLDDLFIDLVTCLNTIPGVFISLKDFRKVIYGFDIHSFQDLPYSSLEIALLLEDSDKISNILNLCTIKGCINQATIFFECNHRFCENCIQRQQECLICGNTNTSQINPVQINLNFDDYTQKTYDYFHCLFCLKFKHISSLQSTCDDCNECICKDCFHERERKFCLCENKETITCNGCQEKRWRRDFFISEQCNHSFVCKKCWVESIYNAKTCTYCLEDLPPIIVNRWMNQHSQRCLLCKSKKLSSYRELVCPNRCIVCYECAIKIFNQNHCLECDSELVPKHSPWE